MKHLYKINLRRWPIQHGEVFVTSSYYKCYKAHALYQILKHYYILETNKERLTGPERTETINSALWLSTKRALRADTHGLNTSCSEDMHCIRSGKANKGANNLWIYQTRFDLVCLAGFKHATLLTLSSSQAHPYIGNNQESAHYTPTGIIATSKICFYMISSRKIIRKM